MKKETALRLLLQSPATDEKAGKSQKSKSGSTTVKGRRNAMRIKGKKTMALICFAFMLALSAKFNICSAQIIHRYDHVLILIEENHPYADAIFPQSSIIGNSAAPNINALATDSNAASFTQMFAITHPSQPNYLDFFSGDPQGTTSDNTPTNYPFTTANLAAELKAAGLTFVTYSEDMPSVGYNGDTYGHYARKHNPVCDWIGTGQNQVDSTENQPFTNFPTANGYDSLPTICYVVPNQVNDMHDGTDPSTITIGDTWMHTYMSAYMQWCMTHNSLFIVTWDEDDGFASNNIPTIFYGPMVKTGQYSDSWNLYNILRTLEDMYGMGYAGSAATSAPITNVWVQPAGINDATQNEGIIKMSPNPASSVLNFYAKGFEGNAPEIWITDATGRFVSKELISPSGSLALNTSNFSAGMYFYHAVAENAVIQSGKFIIEH
jgi:hypothetical protein